MKRCTSCCHSWCCHLGGGGTQLFSLVQPTAGGVLYLVSLCICAVSVAAANEKTRPSERVRWRVRDSSACRRMCVRPYVCVCVCAVCVSQQVFVAHTQIHSVVRSLTRLFSEMCENFNVFAINASVCEALERAAGCAPECVCLCACVSMCCVRLYSVCASNFDWLPKCFSSYAARSCPQRRPSWWRLCETRRGENVLLLRVHLSCNWRGLIDERCSLFVALLKWRNLLGTICCREIFSYIICTLLNVE